MLKFEQGHSAAFHGGAKALSCAWACIIQVPAELSRNLGQGIKGRFWCVCKKEFNPQGHCKLEAPFRGRLPTTALLCVCVCFRDRQAGVLEQVCKRNEISV